MTLGSTFGVMAILLAETLITLGASLQRWYQLQETGVPFTDAIAFQSAVVPVVAIGVIKSFSYPYWHSLGVSPAGSQSAQERQPRRGGRNNPGGGLGGLGWSWWLWEWLCEEVLRDADRKVVAGL